MSHLPTILGEPRHAVSPNSRPPELWIPPSDETPLRDYWRTLKKQRWLIGAVFGAIMVVVLMIVLSAKESYRAEATLLIEPNAPKVLEIPEILSQSFGADSYYETQYEILRSRALAARVVGEQTEVFEGPRRPSTWLENARRSIRGWLPRGDPPTPEEELDGRITGYQKSLSIEPSRETRLVTVAFRDSNPEKAARLANAHSEAYIAQGLALRRRAGSEARSFLVEQSIELRKRVAEAQGKLAAFGVEEGIVALDERSNMVVTRLVDLNAQLTSAESERMAREADWRQVRNRDIGSIPAVIGSPLVGALKQELAKLEDQYASLSGRYQDKHPDLIDLKRQLEESRRRLDLEIQNIAGGIESAYISARAREEGIRRRLASQKDEALAMKGASVEYAMLESELQTSRKLFEEVQERLKQTDVASELRDSNILLLHAATVPVHPSGPSRALLLVAGILLALLGGVGVGLIAEQLDGRISTSDELERQLGLPNLGSVPELGGQSPKRSLFPGRRLGTGARRDGVLHEAEGDPAAHPPLLPVGASLEAIEAYRRIRTNILLSQAAQAPRTLLFTSAGPGEGKSTTTLNTAQLFAQLGGRVLVIDADLRKPDCHRMLGLENGLGLTEILTGGALSPEALHPIGTNLALLVSGKRPPNPTELLGSVLMKKLLESASESFDYILIDAPPLVGVSDSVLLATMVDGVVLVADQKNTQRSQIQLAHTRLVYARAKVLGTVLNRSDEIEKGYALDWAPVV